MTMKDTGQQRQMREIKFRAWLHEDKEMIYFGWYYGVFAEMSLDAQDSNAEMSLDAQDSNSVIVMQYTGLKDKNGKEIYEGDIVVNELNPQGFVIEWSNLGGFTFFCDSEYGSLPEIWEVIGNIYEDANLLSKDK